MNGLLLIIMIPVFPAEHAAGTAGISAVPDTIRNIEPITYDLLGEEINIDSATMVLRNIRKNGDQKRSNELAAMIHAYWKTHRKSKPHPATIGINSPLNNNTHEPDFSTHFGNGNRWTIWVTIDPRVDVYDVKIASSSIGELYTISIWDSLDNDHILVHRSTDGGWNWSVYWEYNFLSDYKISSPGIRIVNDTIVVSYVIHRVADNAWRAWFRACLPGASDSCIYAGSPTTGFNQCKYSDLNLTDDLPNDDENEHLYATWVESYGNGPDSTRVMFARSNELDVGYWELGPSVLYSTTGANVFFAGTDIAFGYWWDDVLWITAWLHPSGYPATYDRSIWGWFSTDFGATWSPENIITPMDNHIDEYDPRIAGSHNNRNWVILFTQADTNYASDRNVGYLYSTDNYTWTSNTWASPYEEYLPDIWVDNSSSAFYGVYRQDGQTFEQILFTKAYTSDPSSWFGLHTVAEQGFNLSGIYRPSVSLNMWYYEAIVAWTQCEDYYQICFASEGWYNISEHINDVCHLDEYIDIIPNPSKGNFKIIYNSNRSNHCTISIYDESGRLVNCLKNTDGIMSWQCTSYSNPVLPPGIYFLRIETAGESLIKKIVVVD